jgi:hypothetical protein
VKYIPTSAEVIACIRIKHKDDLTVFSSFSDPDGTWQGGAGETGRMITEYCFKFQSIPLFKMETTWEIGDTSWDRKNEKTEYWLCVAEKEED